MSIKTIANLKTDADTFVNDNTARDITPADVRDRIKDLADSSINRLDDKLLLNLRVYVTTRPYEVGEACIESGIVYECINATQGTFTPADWTALGAAGSFLTLSDTPASYIGQALKGVRVNAGETGLEFYTIPTGTIGGSGTINRIPRFTGTTTLGDSDIEFTANEFRPIAASKSLGGNAVTNRWDQFHIGGKMFTYNTPFVIDNNGNDTIRLSGANAGFGTTPTTRVHIFGSPTTSFRLEDTNQGVGKVLTSDANGVGTWATLPGGSNFANADLTFTANRSHDLATFNMELNNGNVGFNVAPTARVHAKGSTSGAGAFTFKAEDSVGNLNFFVENDGKVNSRLGYWFNGDKILYLGATSVSNLFNGYGSGNGSQTGLNNTGNGLYTGNALTTGFQNTLGGAYSGEKITTAINQTSYGFEAGRKNNANNLTSVGASSGVENLSGQNNSFYGASSGATNTAGNNLVIIGSFADVLTATGISDAVAIGRLAIITASNQFVVGSPTSKISEYYFGHGVYANTATAPINFNPTGIQGGVGNSNISASGNVFYINGAVGTGTGVGGDIRFQVAPAGGSSDTQNVLSTYMTIKGSGIINMVLPTSSAGLVSGDLWNNSGVVNII